MEKEYQLEIIDVLGNEYRNVFKSNTTQSTKEIALDILNEADLKKWFYLENDDKFIKYDNVVSLNVIEYKEIDLNKIKF